HATTEFYPLSLHDALPIYKVSLLQVVEAINRSGIDLPAGKIQTETENNSVRLVGKYNDINAIKNVQVAMPFPNSPVYVKDVAEVSDGIKEISSYSRFNGKAGIGLMIKKQGDANAVDVSSLIKEKFQSIEKHNANSEVQFVVTDDSTDNTIAAVNSVVIDLILAVTLVSFVML